MTDNICAICGGSFGAENRRFKYCSVKCRKTAKERNDLKNNTKEKRRLYMQEYRGKIYEERMKELVLRPEIPKEVLNNKREEHLQELHDNLERRVKNGEPLANMILARREKRIEDYWKWFALYAIEFDEHRNRVCSCIVNGVSVYEDNFSKKVIGNIKRDNKIYISH